MRVLNSKIQTNQDSQSRAAESSSFMAGYTLETRRAFRGGIQIKHLTTLPTSNLSSLFNVLRTPQQSPHLPFATVLPTTRSVWGTCPHLRETARRAHVALGIPSAPGLCPLTRLFVTMASGLAPLSRLYSRVLSHRLSWLLRANTQTLKYEVLKTTSPRMEPTQTTAKTDRHTDNLRATVTNNRKEEEKNRELNQGAKGTQEITSPYLSLLQTRHCSLHSPRSLQKSRHRRPRQEQAWRTQDFHTGAKPYSGFPAYRRERSYKLVCRQSDANTGRSLPTGLVLHRKLSPFWHVSKLFFLETTSRKSMGICPSNTANGRRGAAWDWDATDLFKGFTKHSGCSLGQALAAGLGQGLAGGQGQSLQREKLKVLALGSLGLLAGKVVSARLPCRFSLSCSRSASSWPSLVLPYTCLVTTVVTTVW